MWLHGGRFLNGVCLYIRCCHNTPGLAMNITIVAPKETQLIVAKMARFTQESTVEDLLGFIYDKVQVNISSMRRYQYFGFSLPQGFEETTHIMVKPNGEEDGEAKLRKYQLDVYMRDVLGAWYWLTSSTSPPKDNGSPSLDMNNPSADVLVTNYEGTWPGLCVWVRWHVPLWVVSRDLVGSVQ
eukprot:GHVU01119905.1.p1 GENE.GHVU01119905.1~~GHVU01119905.1.p1  ORF type:complete len:183 (-),score=19.20 GHVU01119905.1:89-637(-)